jgi:hypothetical protein
MKRAMTLKPALMLTLALLLTGCVTNGGADCAGWKAIRLDGASINGLTERDARDILAHNEFGEARGCW